MPGLDELFSNNWNRVASDYPMSIPALLRGLTFEMTPASGPMRSMTDIGREQFGGDPFGGLLSGASYGPLAWSPSFRRQADAAMQLPGPATVNLPKASIDDIMESIQKLASKLPSNISEDVAQEGALAVYTALSKNAPAGIDPEVFVRGEVDTVINKMLRKSEIVSKTELTGQELARELRTNIESSKGPGVRTENPNIRQVLQDQESFKEPYSSQQSAAAETEAISRKGFLKNETERSIANKFFFQGKSHRDVVPPAPYDKSITRRQQAIDVRKKITDFFGEPDSPAVKLRNAGHSPDQVKQAIDNAFATIKQANKQLKSTHPVELYLGIERRGGQWVFSKNKGLSPSNVAKRLGHTDPIFKQYLETIRQRVSEALQGKK